MNIKLKRAWQLFAAMGLLTLSGCSSGREEITNASPSQAIAVTIASPSVAGQHNINISGQVESSQSVNISTRIMGYITMLKVKTGDRVSKGQLLVTINNQDILAKRAQADAMIAEAQAALNNAQKDYERFSILYNQQSATAKELEEVTLQYNAVRTKLDAAMQMRNEVNASLGYTSLTAPFSGIVTQKLADAGSMANPGMPILTIERSGSYEIGASVPEYLISQIHPGAEAIISIKSIDKTIKGAVTQINPSSQFTGGQYIIKVNIADNEKAGLYAGMYADVSIPVKGPAVENTSAGAVLVPVSSIERRGQLTGLYTIGSNNTALLRWVRLGKTYGDKVEVLTGLEKNEQFIVSADGRLQNGISVKIK